MKNFNSLDIAKVVAALFVVTIHKDPFHEGLANDIIVGIIARLAVPFFYITSSFLFFRKPNIDCDAVLHYVKRLSILFLFWFIFEIPFMYLKYFAYSENLLSTDILFFVRTTFLGNIYDGAYFIMALIVCVPLVYLLSIRFNNKVLLTIGICLYLLSSACDTYYSILPMKFREIADTINIVIGDISVSFIPCFIFVVVGKIIAEKSEECFSLNLFNLGIILCTLIILCFFETAFNHNISNQPVGHTLRLHISKVFAAISLFLFVLNIKANWDLPYKSLRVYSTILFFSHVIFVQLTYLFNYHVVDLLHLNDTAQYFLVIVLSTITYFIMIWGSKTKLFSWMRFGY